MNSLSVIDIVVITLYFVIIIFAGLYFSRRTEDNTKSYFLAGKNVGWISLGAALFATNISSEHFIGLAGAGASSGLAVGSFEWLAIFFLMLLGWFFAPIFLRSGVFTTPEFIGKRFDDSSRFYLAGISIATYVFTKISITLFAGGLLLHKVIGIDMYITAVIMVVITGIYTIIGGMGTVIYTSVIQAVFLLCGAVLLTVLGLNEVGGIEGLRAQLNPGYFEIFKSASDKEFPWTGIIFGAPILAIWYWCTDQYIVQRILSARDLESARSGSILAGFLKLLPVFIFVIPGLVAAVLYPGINGDEAYASLISGTLLPVGIKGLVLAGVLAAMMSSLSACFNSTATLFTMDFYRRFNPGASQSKLVLVGRLATTVIVLTAILWIPLTKLISTHIYLYLQSIQAFISPPIAAVFLFGIFWKRANSKGALWTFLIGGGIGIVRLIIEIINMNIGIENIIIKNIIGINYLHFAIILFAISSFTMIIVSLVSEKVKSLEKFKFMINKTDIKATSNSVQCIKCYRKNWLFSSVLILIMISLWASFV